MDDSHRTLWLGVIHNAIRDACFPLLANSGRDDASREQFRETHKRHARAWLNGRLQNFEDVCRMAGVSPDLVRRSARKIISHFDKYGDYPSDFRLHLSESL